MFRQTDYYSTLAFTSCFHGASWLTRSECLGPSWVFPGYAHNTTHACGFLDPQKYVRVFQSLYGHLISQLLLLSVLVNLFSVATAITSSGSSDIKQLPLIVSHKQSWGKCCSQYELCIRSNKDKPCEWGSPGNHKTGKIMAVFLEWGFGGPPNLFCPLQ